MEQDSSQRGEEVGFFRQGEEESCLQGVGEELFQLVEEAFCPLQEVEEGSFQSQVGEESFQLQEVEGSFQPEVGVFYQPVEVSYLLEGLWFCQLQVESWQQK